MATTNNSTAAVIETDSAAAIQKLLDTGITFAPVKDLHGYKPAVVIPAGYKLAGLEEDLDVPKRLKQTVKTYDAKSFSDYFTDFCTEDSRVFYDLEARKVVGVLDYHARKFSQPEDPQKKIFEGVAPSWNEHKVEAVFRKTKEWETWTKNNGEKKDPVPFARLLEDNQDDIFEPKGAALLEMCQKFEAKRAIEVESSVKQNGEYQLNYKEEVRGNTVAGSLQFPDQFVILIQPFEGSVHVKIRCRLRWTLTEQKKLLFWYDMVAPHKVEEAAVKAFLRDISEKIENPILAASLA
jgi:uncharacterized protein YfdQ (DUF2303 family)